MRNKGISLLIPALFLGMLLLIGGALASEDISLTQVDFRDSEHDLSLTACYDAVSGQYYLYLPSFTDRGAISLSCPWYMDAEVSLNGETTAVLPLEETLEVRLSYLWGEKRTYPLQVMACSAKETVYIEAQDGVLDHIHESQANESEVFVTFLDASGETEYRGSSFLSGRGNGTWAWDKKPYDLRFSDPITVGPFSGVEKLCLMAEYFDTSKLRNALGYYMGREAGVAYATDYIFADVYMNGEYLGLYGIATKQEYTKHIQEDGIVSVFELSSSGKQDAFYTEGLGKAIRMHYGDEALAYDRLLTMETALLNQDWETLYQTIDLMSWARKYVMEEFLFNYDLTLTSQYFYLDGDGLIRCMLPWDYEWVFYSRLDPFDPAQEYVLTGYWNRTNWFQLLLESEEFRSAVVTILEEDYTQDFLRRARAYLEDCEAEIQGSRSCDLRRWASAYAVSHSISPDTAPMDRPADFARYFTARLDFLNRLFRDWDGHCLISFYSQFDDTRQPAKLQLILPKGADLTGYHDRIRKSLTTPEGYEFLGWYTEAGVPMEEVIVLSENLSLIGHYRSVPKGDAP